jgi:hypothetical protein
MYKGYVFACGSASLKSCVKNKRYACSEGQVDASEGIETGAVVFLHVLESDRLIGPFTVTEKLRTDLQPGTWTSSIERNSFSGNIKVEWEELHQLENAQKRIKFLGDMATCTLSHFQTQELLDVLKDAPRFQY